MSPTFPRQQVLLLTYNQSKYIRQCLNSIVFSTVLPWRVTVFDDFSTDGTREIIQQYNLKYPSIFELVFNEKNLGIFGNLSQTKKYAKGDLIHNMAGDDWFDKCFFEEMQDFYINECLSSDSSAFVIIPSFSYVSANGRVIKAESKSYPPSSSHNVAFSDFLRDRVKYRYSGMSKTFFSYWPDRINSRTSLWWDRYYYLEHHLHVETVYFLPSAHSFYRLGSGCTSVADHSQIQLSFVSALTTFMHDYSHLLSYSDFKYLLRSIQLSSTSLSGTLFQFFCSGKRFYFSLDVTFLFYWVKQQYLSFKKFLSCHFK